MKPKVAFIVVCWNNSDLLKTCLNTIKEQDYPEIETILVDNDSKDDSVEVARKLMPDIRIIQNESNRGFAEGNNIGIKEALEDKSVKYVALLNTDATLDKSWTSSIVNFCKDKPQAACLQGTTLDYYDHDVIDSTHIYLARSGQATQGNWREYYQGAEYGPRKVFGVNAAACVITRDFIEAQPFKDLFDQTMFMYLEDVDLSTRATIMGWDNYLVPGARAYHMGSVSSSKKDPSYSLYMTFRNNSGVILKNMPIGIMFKLMPRIAKSDYQTFQHLRKQGKSKAARSIVKARFAATLYVPIFLFKRLKLSRHKNIDTDYLWTIMKKGY
ncbi:MAG: glycosyltransferase family 2 protein [Candidatus Saccharibacteria bacterium]